MFQVRAAVLPEWMWRWREADSSAEHCGDQPLQTPHPPLSQVCPRHRLRHQKVPGRLPETVKSKLLGKGAGGGGGGAKGEKKENVTVKLDVGDYKFESPFQY